MINYIIFFPRTSIGIQLAVCDLAKDTTFITRILFHWEKKRIYITKSLWFRNHYQLFLLLSNTSLKAKNNVKAMFTMNYNFLCFYNALIHTPNTAWISGVALFSSELAQFTSAPWARASAILGRFFSYEAL